MSESPASKGPASKSPASKSPASDSQPREIHLEIDGSDVTAKEGMTVLEAAREAGIAIPALCFHQDLEPYGGCRLCIVEAGVNGRTRLVVSCVYEAEDDMVVRTRSGQIDRIRKTILELLLAHAPHSETLKELAGEYGADPRRFQSDASFCVHCGLCVRYCAEVKKAHALGFVDRGVRKEISFIPEIALRECPTCKKCFPLCPTSYLQAAYVLIEALTTRSLGE